MEIPPRSCAVLKQVQSLNTNMPLTNPATIQELIGQGLWAPRMALGARPGDVLRLVVGQGMRLAAAGMVLGIASALAVTRLIGSLLFDIPTYDPATFGAVSVFVAGVAFIAGWLPARRAARIDPVFALRQD